MPKTVAVILSPTFLLKSIGNLRFPQAPSASYNQHYLDFSTFENPEKCRLLLSRELIEDLNRTHFGAGEHHFVNHLTRLQTDTPDPLRQIDAFCDQMIKFYEKFQPSLQLTPEEARALCLFSVLFSDVFSPGGIVEVSEHAKTWTMGYGIVPVLQKSCMQVNRLPDGSLSLVSSAPTFQDAKKHQTVHVSYPVKIVCVGDQAFRATLDDHYTFKIPQEFWQAIISECQEKLKDVKRDERFFEQHQDGELTFYYVPLLQEREIRALFSLMLTRLSWKNPQINFDALAHAIWLNFQDHPKILSQITKDFDRYPALQGITDILRMNSASRKGRSWWSAILAPKTAAGSAQEVKPPPPAPLAPKQ